MKLLIAITASILSTSALAVLSLSVHAQQSPSRDLIVRQLIDPPSNCRAAATSKSDVVEQFGERELVVTTISYIDSPTGKWYFVPAYNCYIHESQVTSYAVEKLT
jgi:hypothetical protein